MHMCTFFNSARELSSEEAKEALTNHLDIAFILKFYAYWIKYSKVTSINSIIIIYKIF